MTETTTSVRVRYKETDQMGVVYYSNYFVWFEIAMAEFFKNTGHPYSKIEETGLKLMVVRATCTYMASAKYDDLLDVSCKLKSLKTSSISFQYNIRRGGQVLAEGETVHVFTNGFGKAQHIPHKIREALA